MPQRWEIVGGGDKGGILVKEGQNMGTKALKERLSTGAIVEEISLKGDRLNYKLLTGTGPAEGWVSVKLPDKDLAVRTDKGGAGDGAAAAKDDAPADAGDFDLKAFLDARCEKELKRDPANWTPVGMDVLMAKFNDKSKGIFYGMEFPWDEKTLSAMGPAWVTKAFHAAGSMPKDNKVTKVKNIKTYIGGGACAKLTFDVEYAKKVPYLHTGLFAKIPWPLEGATKSDRMASSIMQQGMEIGEINAMRLLESKYPFRIPRYYYGDVSNETTNFIIITERIPFGQKEGGLTYDPPYEKGRDWELKGTSKEYYFLLLREGAKMAGHYWAGKLAPIELMDKFFTPNMRPPEHWGMGPHNTGLPDKEFAMKIKMGAEFISVVAKALFPDNCTSEQGIKTWKKTLNITNVYTNEASYWCNRNKDYVAYSHGNLNVDNVFFWRDAEEQLGVGVLDWGGARTDSMGWKLWWWLYGCEYDFLNDQIDPMLEYFIEQYEETGGPKLDLKELKFQFILSALGQGVGLLGAVPQIYRMCKKTEWPSIKDRKDPRIVNNIDGKNTLRIYVLTFISVARMIQEWGIPGLMDKWMDEVAGLGIPKKALTEG